MQTYVIMCFCSMVSNPIYHFVKFICGIILKVAPAIFPWRKSIWKSLFIMFDSDANIFPITDHNAWMNVFKCAISKSLKFDMARMNIILFLGLNFIASCNCA